MTENFGVNNLDLLATNTTNTTATATANTGRANGIEYVSDKTSDYSDTVSSKSSKSQEEMNAKIQEIKNKYCKGIEPLPSGRDPHHGENPEVVALGKLLDDGVLIDLANEGFSKTQIVSIIEEAFPTVGISANGTDGNYNVPKGHDEVATEIYSKFSSQLYSATGGADSEEISAAKEELSLITKQISANNREMETLKTVIEQLQQEIEEETKKAIQESEDIKEDQKAQAQDAVSKRLKEYTNSNGEMDYKTFQKNISKDLNGIQTNSQAKLGNVIINLLNTNSKMELVKGHVANLKNISVENQNLTKEADSVTKELNNLIKEQAENGEGDPQANCCDPIGFITDDARYDLFVDKDNNQDVTNEQEFLGSKDGFNEAKALDTNNDGLVTGEELDAANVKMVKTNTDGTQEVINASEVFKNATDGIDLLSYQETNQDIGEGNTLLGTFDTKINEERLDGYQTFDTLDWLDENYEFTDEAEGKGRFVQGKDEFDETLALDYSVEADAYEVKNQELETELQKANESWGIDKTKNDSFISKLSSEASEKGSKIAQKFEEISAKEAKEAKEAEELEELEEKKEE